MASTATRGNHAASASTLRALVDVHDQTSLADTRLERLATRFAELSLLLGLIGLAAMILMIGKGT